MAQPSSSYTLSDLSTRFGLELRGEGEGLEEDPEGGVDALHREGLPGRWGSGQHTAAGLGLPLVREIVEAHHGRLSCSSEPGAWTCFEIAQGECEAAFGVLKDGCV